VRFPFNERKAAQAAAFLLKRHNGTLHYLLLIKLLYYADRQALLEKGRPITGDQMVSMDKGPVLSKTYDLIRSTGNVGRDWHEYVSERTGGFTVRLAKTDPETDKLSSYELGVLAEIDKRHGSKDRFDLSAESHRLPEWVDPDGSSIPIDALDILRVEHRSEKDIRETEETARVEWFFRRLDDSE
jgi:uncharacterized phage-associated protein